MGDLCGVWFGLVTEPASFSFPMTVTAWLLHSNQSFGSSCLAADVQTTWDKQEFFWWASRHGTSSRELEVWVPQPQNQHCHLAASLTDDCSMWMKSKVGLYLKSQREFVKMMITSRVYPLSCAFSSALLSTAPEGLVLKVSLLAPAQGNSDKSFPTQSTISCHAS